MKRWCVWVSLAMVLAGAQAAWCRPVPMELSHLGLLRAVSSPTVSPDGTWVAFTSGRVSFDDDSRSEEIKLAAVGTGLTVPVAEGSQPRWSPDGRQLAYLSNGDGASQDGAAAIWLYEIASKKSRKLVDVFASDHFLGHEADKSFAWSPQGDAIAYLSADAAAPAQDAAPQPKVISRSQYKTRTGFSDNRSTHIYWVSTEAQKAASPRALTSGPYDEHSISWSPDGREIVFVSNRSANPDENYSDDLFAVAVQPPTTKTTAGKAEPVVRRLTDTAGTEMAPAFSPDGQWIAYLATARPTNTKDSQVEDPHLYLLPAAGGKARDLTASLDRRPHELVWAPDSKSLFFTIDDQGRRPVLRVSLAAEPAVAERFTDGFAQISTLSLDRGGKALVYLKSDVVHPAEVWVTQIKGQRSHQVTQENKLFLATVQLQNIDTVRVSSFDDTHLQSFVMKPAGFRNGAKFPLVLWVHGGPHGMVGYGFSERYQLLAGQGLGVLFVNPRGSTGYGQKFGDGALNDWGGGDYRDLMAALDQAIKEFPWIDPQRLGVAGGSYGGYMTNWIVTQTDRFKAAAALASLSNLVSFYGTSLYSDLIEVEFSGRPWEGNNFETLWRHSPLAFIDRVKTPTLLIHGESDHDVPIEQAEEMYTALKRRGIDTLMVRYPGEGHGIRKPRFVLDQYRRLFDWFGRYLEPVKPQPPPAAVPSPAAAPAPAPPPPADKDLFAKPVASAPPQLKR